MLTERYLNIKFVSPTTGKLIEKWISVSDIISLTMEREKRKRKAGKKEKSPPQEIFPEVLI